jgi:hypothetical protein
MSNLKIFERIKSFGTWIGVARNLGWLLMAIAGAVYLIGKYTGSGTVPPVFSYSALGLVAFGLGLLVGTLAMMRRMSNAREYSWESAEYLYEFNADDVLKHQQTVKVTIKANKQNVEVFKNRYSWTGSGGSSPLPQLLSPGHKLITEISRDAQWKYYYVVFDRPLRKGATTELEVRQDLYDRAKTFQSMLAKDVIEPIGSLKLRVIFPPSMRPKDARAIELTRPRNGGNEWEIADECPVPVDTTTGEAVYDVGRPKTGARYQIIWNDANYPRAEDGE